MSKTLHKIVSFCLFVFGLSCFTPLLFAGDDWKPIDPADLKETSEPGQPNADAVILYREYIRDLPGGKESTYIQIKILTEKGKEQWSNVEIDYNKNDLKLKDLKARTIHADGTTVPLEGEGFDKTVAKSRQVKIFARTFTMPQVEVGSIIEYRYVLHENECCYLRNDWIVQQQLYQRKAYFEFRAGSLRGPHMSWTPYLPPDAPKPNHDKDGLDLTIEHVPALEEEPLMPPVDQIAYRVRFFYVPWGVSHTDQFWDMIGQFWRRDVEEFIGHNSGHIKDAVTQIVAADDTPEQKSRKIYAEIQKFENLSYVSSQERDESKQKQEKLPDSAEKVIKQRRGSSFDLARAYVAMARAAGLHAYLMRVSARDRWLFDKSFLESAQLDTEIAIVQIDGKDVFLDPGTQFCPYGLLDWPDTRVYGIRETDSEKVEIASTPVPQFRDNKTLRTALLHLLDDGSLAGDVGLQLYGAEAMRHRQEALEKDMQERTTDLEMELKRMLPEGSTVKLESGENWTDAEKPLSLHFHATIPNYSTVMGKHILLPESLFHDEDTEIFTHASRTQAIQFSYSYFDVDDVTIQLPDKLTVEDIPQKQAEKRSYIGYVLTAKNDKQEITIHREFAVGRYTYDAKEYPDLRSFYEQVRTGDGQQIVLHTVAAAPSGSGNAN